MHKPLLKRKAVILNLQGHAQKEAEEYKVGLKEWDVFPSMKNQGESDRGSSHFEFL